MDDVVAVIGGLAIPIIFFVLMIAAAANIVRRAGYSPWYVVGLLIPFLNIVLMCLFAFRRWPIEGELVRLRAKAGEHTLDDIDKLLDEARRLESAGDWTLSMEAYDLVAQYSTDRQITDYSRSNIARLKTKSRGSV